MRTATPHRKLMIARDGVQAPIRWRESVISRAWWISPAVLAVTLWGFVALLTSSLGEGSYRSYWDTQKWITTEFRNLVFLCAAAFAIGSFGTVQVMRAGKRRLGGAWVLNEGFRKVIFRLWLFGVAITFLVATINQGGPGALLSQIFLVLSGSKGSSGQLRDTFAPVSGITSFTQLGLLIAMVETMKLKWLPSSEPGRATSRRRLIAVIAYGLFRAMLVSERLAFVEVVVPALVVWVRAQPLRSLRQAVFTSILPVLSVFVLLFGFAGTEYFRSYQTAKLRTDDSLLEFSETRLIGYYAAALNNSALHMYRGSSQAPFSRLLQGMLDWPKVRSTLQISDPRQIDRVSLLHEYANPEFTNVAPPGVLANEGNFVYITAFMIGFGALAGASYAGYRFGSPGASVWFGVVTMSVLEFPRIWYLTSSRMSMVIVVALIAWLRYYRVGR